MKLSPCVPELPVRDVEIAQAYYRDQLGFKIEWLYPGAEIGAVSRGDCALFLRRTAGPLRTGTCWIFADDVDAAYADFEARAANIVEPIADKPWGLRQFTVEDLHGNRFHIHHDL